MCSMVQDGKSHVNELYIDNVDLDEDVFVVMI